MKNLINQIQLDSQLIKDIKTLEDCSDKYFNGLESKLTDEDYDMLFQDVVNRLNGLNIDKGTIQEFKDKVGSPTTAQQTIQHSTKMLSLQKAYTKEEIEKFLTKIRKQGESKLSIEHKIDGVAFKATYQFRNNTVSLKYAATRGNGLIGENISWIADYGILDKLKQAAEQMTSAEKPNITFIGELYMPEQNSRNKVAGALRLKDKSKFKELNIKALVFDCLERTDFKNFILNSHSNMIEDMSVDNVMRYIRSALDTPFDDINMPTDGVVIKCHSSKVKQDMGCTQHHPRWAIAFKENKFFAKSELHNVEWSVDRKGFLNPVAIIQEIELAGRKVKRVSLHNIDKIKKLNLRIGDSVYIKISGDVIPCLYKSDNNGSGEFIEEPLNCLSCNGTMAKIGNRKECINKDSGCKGVLLARLVHLVSREGLDIKGIGKATAQKIINIEGFNKISDFFNIDISKANLGKKTIDKMKQEMSIKVTKEALNNLSKSVEYLLDN